MPGCRKHFERVGAEHVYAFKGRGLTGHLRAEAHRQRDAAPSAPGQADMRVLSEEQLSLHLAAKAAADDATNARRRDAAQRRDDAARRNLAAGRDGGGDGSGTPALLVPPLVEGASWPAEPLAGFGSGGSPTAAHFRLVAAVDVSLAIAGGHVGILRRVPRQLGALWGAALELTLDMAARDDEQQQIAGHALLLLLPSITLRFTRGERTRWGSYKAMAHRLKRFVAGDWQQLIEEWWAADRAALAAEQSREPQLPGDAARRDSLVKRLMSLLSEGQISRALALIDNQRGTAALTTQVIQQLRDLHPPAKKPVNVDALRRFTVPDGKRIAVTAIMVADQLRSAPKHSAGGPSRLSFDHLREPVLASEAMLQTLTKLVQRMLDGDVPPRVTAMLADSRLIALLKPNGKPRPIAIGDTIRRLAGRVLLARLTERASGVLLPHQLGVGARGAAEAILHVVNAFLRQHPHHTLLIFDYKNAFNCTSRAAALNAVMADETLCAAVPYLRLFYTKEAQLWLHATDAEGRPRSILSREGAQQGDVFGMLLFALATIALVRRIRTRATRADGTAVYYADDGIALVRDGAAKNTVLFVERKSEKLGLTMCREETVALKLHGVIPQSVRDLGLLCKDTLLPEAERGTELLGGPVGSDAFAEAFLDGKVAEARATVEQLTTLLGDEPAAAALLLRRGVAQRFLHLTRCCRPSITAPAARAFDEVIRNGELQLAAPGASAVLSPAAALKLKLPCREGGFGVSSAEELAPVAYIASVLAARRLASAIWSGFSEVAPLDSIAEAAAAAASDDSLPFGADLENHSPSAPLLAAVASLRPATAAELAAACRDMLEAEAEGAEGGGGDADDVVADGDAQPEQRNTALPLRRPHPAAGLQRRLAQTLVREDVRKLRDDVLAADPAGRALHLAETGYCGVGAWTAGLPGRDSMDARTYHVNMAWSLGLPIAAFDGLTCRCRCQLTAETGLAHVLSCQSLVFLRSGRHHLLGLAFDTITQEQPGVLRILGLGCADAPTVGTIVDRDGTVHEVKPDRIIIGIAGYAPAVRLIVDYVLPNPARASTTAAGTTKLAAVNEEHAIKVAHYSQPELGLRAADRITPISIDLGGGVHPSVIRLLGGWAKRCAAFIGGGGDSVVERAQRILRGWQIRLAVALAHSRALFVEDALRALTPGAAANNRPSVFDMDHPYSPRARRSGAPGRRVSRSVG